MKSFQETRLKLHRAQSTFKCKWYIYLLVCIDCTPDRLSDSMIRIFLWAQPSLHSAAACGTKVSPTRASNMNLFWNQMHWLTAAHFRLWNMKWSEKQSLHSFSERRTLLLLMHQQQKEWLSPFLSCQVSIFLTWCHKIRQVSGSAEVATCLMRRLARMCSVVCIRHIWSLINRKYHKPGGGKKTTIYTNKTNGREQLKCSHLLFIWNVSMTDS